MTQKKTAPRRFAHPAGADAGQDEREDQVRLKPVLGLRPGVCLAVLYSCVLLVILFFVLIFPGLVRPGSLVALQTEPAGAALRVDGVYRGTAPDRIFVSQGRRVLEVSLPGFTAERIECEIPGRLFASALFPRLYPLKITLRAPEPATAFALAASDYAAWTFGGEPGVSWQIPLSLSEGAYRIGAAGSGPRYGAVAELLKAAARFAVTRAALRDLVRAKTIADNGGLSPSPVSLIRSAADVAGFLSDNPGAALWLAETLPPESAALLTASAWYQKQLAGAGANTTPAAATGARPPARQLRLGGLAFTGIDSGVLFQAEPFPRRVPVGAFMISSAPVPAAVFEEFLAANFQWRPDQREALVEKDLVTGEYLLDSGNADDGSITAVSWYAARAFCAWLSERLPASMADYEVRLPTEAEWEYAAKSADPGARFSAFWEWCADPYAPLAFIRAAPEAIAAVSSPERAVRGGSRLNPAGSATVEIRASLPPDFCSPFVSFRPVIAPKGSDAPFGSGLY